MTNKKELAAGIVFLTIGITLYTIASSYPVKEGASVVLSPGFYPKLLSVIMAGLSLKLIFDSIRNNQEEECAPPQKKAFLRTKGGRTFFLTLGLLILYPFVLEFLGFASAAFLFIFVLIFALTEEAKSRLISIGLVSVLLTIIMFVVFKIILNIPFPDGLLI